jgi:hypothetical protein
MSGLGLQPTQPGIFKTVYVPDLADGNYWMTEPTTGEDASREACEIRTTDLSPGTCALGAYVESHDLTFVAPGTTYDSSIDVPDPGTFTPVSG